MSTSDDGAATPEPPAPPAPPTTTPGATSPPASDGRMSPPLLIAIVAVAVLVLGGVMFVIGLVVGGVNADVPLTEQQASADTAEVVTPIPDAAEPVEEPIPDVPSLEPIPDVPVEEAIPEETAPEETALEETILEEQNGDAPTVPVGLGITAIVPAGWQAETLDETTVAIGTDGGGAILGIYTAPPGATGAELISFYVQESLSESMTDLEVTQPEPLALDVPSVTSAATNVYQGTYVSQQGSFPLEGLVWAFIRADGTALVIDGYWAPGVDITDELSDITVSALTTM